MEKFRPDFSSKLKGELSGFEKLAMQAVGEYTEDRRVVGNTFLAQARQHSISIENEISAFVDAAHRQATLARDEVCE